MFENDQRGHENKIPVMDDKPNEKRKGMYDCLFVTQNRDYIYKMKYLRPEGERHDAANQLNNDDQYQSVFVLK